MPRVAIFGAAPDTMNMGVSALLAALLDGLSERVPEIEFVVFDNSLGIRHGTIWVSENKKVSVTLAGVRSGKRVYRPENLSVMFLCAKLGRPFMTLHPMLRLLNSCDAFLNISGGDSFSDIYGRKRFETIVLPMRIAKALGKPLILPPQTYGPYANPDIRENAASAVKAAALCFARDARSFDILKGLLDDEFDPDRHQCGVDVAFGLSTRDASTLLPEKIQTWLSSDQPMIGINVNGLIFKDPEKARKHYRFKADYRRSLHEFITWILENTEHKVVLIPHVMQPVGHYESDEEACLAVADALPEMFQDRIAVTPLSLDQCQTKWVISKMDWFCGTRMHSTIAALSSGVPTASIVYSDKASGVFASCGQEAHALDPRTLSTEEIVSGLQHSFDARTAIRKDLANQFPAVETIVQKQMDAICRSITNTHY